MAMPISAFLRAGASLTPSPVMAVTSFMDCRYSTILDLWKGSTRANILGRNCDKNSITGKDNDKYKLDENSEKGNFFGRNWAPPTKSSRTIERQKHQDYSLIMLAGRVSCLPFLIDLTWTARRRSFVLRQTGRQIHGQSMPCRQRARPKTKQITTGNIDCRLKYTSLKVASLFNIEIIIPRWIFRSSCRWPLRCSCCHQWSWWRGCQPCGRSRWRAWLRSWEDPACLQTIIG